MTGAHDSAYVNHAQAAARTVFINTSPCKAADFRLIAQDNGALFSQGVHGAEKFFTTWDGDKWKARDYS